MDDNRSGPWFRLGVMHLDLREALAQGFGPEPPHRPLVDRLQAGHRAVRRRRIAGAVVTVAAAAAVGLGATALAGGAPDRPGQVATEQTASPQPEPKAWEGSDLVRYSDSGMVEVRPGVIVLQRIDEPLGDPSEYNHSVALAVEFQGAESWVILDWFADPDGGSSEMAATAYPTGGTFAEWVEQQVAANEDNSAGVVHFADDGTLAATHGVEILDQVRAPNLPANFAPPGVPTAAALLKGPDGKRWYVLVRDVDGLETISTPFRTGGEDLQEFLDYARSRYASGEGLR